MTKKHLSLSGVSVVLICSVLVSYVGIASAETSSSTHYTVTETQFGGGASLNDCSSSYCSKISIGDAAVGNAASTNYKALFGSDTSDQPLLEVITSGGSEDLGTLSPSAAATATETVKVRNYLSSGYTMQITGSPPSQGVHPLDNLTTPTASSPGSEQFGINLVANTDPAIGADPVQVPSSATSFGAPTFDYDSPNHFKYVDDDIIASSSSSSGETDYTISMIFNVSNVTPGGNYSGNYSIVVVPVY